jgi:hypothetical protein
MLRWEWADDGGRYEMMGGEYSELKRVGLTLAMPGRGARLGNTLS